MELIVCVKQVPGTTQVEMDPVTGTLKRDGVSSKMNPYDLFALEAALTLRERCGGKITALTMGPPQAKSILLEAVSMGADGAVLLSDRKLGGADVLATAYALSQAVKGRKWDILFCGKQTTDGDTAQVGAETAEFLGVPHVSNVTAIEDIGEDHVDVRVDLDTHVMVQRLPLPCVLCMDRDVNTPRLPSWKRRRELTEEPIEVLSVADLPDPDPKRYGLNGSPTKVERIFQPEKAAQRQMICGSAEETATALTALLAEKKFLQEV